MDGLKLAHRIVQPEKDRRKENWAITHQPGRHAKFSIARKEVITRFSF
jgi:hypothetical protein